MTLNFYQAIQPMLIISKIFGVISFKFGQKGYKLSTFNVYLKIVISLMYVALIGYAISARTKFLFYSKMVTTTDVMQLVVNALLVVTAWVLSARYQKKSIMILLRLLNFDKEMRKLGVWISYDKLNRLVYVQIVIRSILIAVAAGYQAFVMHYENYGSMVSEILFQILCHLPIIINTVTCQEVSTYIAIFRKRFQILNEHLSKLQNDSNSLLSDGIKIIKLPTFLGTKLKMLRVICPLHHELSKLSEVFNERFGAVLLMSFLNTFVSTVVNLYFCSTFWQDAKMPNKIHILTSGLLNCATFSIETIYICYMCNTTVEEANKSGSLIHKIDTDDNDVKDQIEMFSLQIVHKRVEFSAAGLFPINYTLLFSIVGGVTTNLVILIQFSATSI